jgi:hypothetical protein
MKLEGDDLLMTIEWAHIVFCSTKCSKYCRDTRREADTVYYLPQIFLSFIC